MQSTAVAPIGASVPTATPASLAAAFAAVPDPRRQASITYPLASILALAVTALLSAQTSVLAIAEWGQRQSVDFLAQLGFPDGRTPCQSTLQRLFAKLDGPLLAAMLADHFAGTPPPAGASVALQGVAIDGKAHQGRLAFDAGGCPVHALSAFCHDSGVVLAHAPIGHGADKAEAELTVAPQLIAQLDWHGRVLTGDALFCQRQLCQQVIEAGGDYLLVVRANQPQLLDAIQARFDPPVAGPAFPPCDRREAWTHEHGHGRQAEVRHLMASTDLTPFLTYVVAWPGVAQVFRLERTWREHGQPKHQRLYGVTSLPPDVGSPERLLTLKRGHWAIENGLHRTKDVSFAEDASLIHVGQGPTIMALLRDTAIGLLHRAGIRRIAARLRVYSQYPDRALPLLLEVPIVHA